MNKSPFIIISLGLVIGLGIILFSGPNNVNENGSIKPGENAEIIEGIQYITIDANGGYSPQVSSAKADIPTKLIVKTNGTYDCSSALVIRSIGYHKMLPQTGEEIIDIGTFEAGSSLQGTCSMGMYNFVVNFS